MKYFKEGALGLCMCMVIGCDAGSVRPTPQPVERTVIWAWESGLCNTSYHLYRVIDAQHEYFATTTETSFIKKMKPEPNTVWLVGAVCEDGRQYFSEPVVMVMP